MSKNTDRNFANHMLFWQNKHTQHKRIGKLVIFLSLGSSSPRQTTMQRGGQSAEWKFTFRISTETELFSLGLMIHRNHNTQCQIVKINYVDDQQTSSSCTKSGWKIAQTSSSLPLKFRYIHSSLVWLSSIWYNMLYAVKNSPYSAVVFRSENR